MHRLLAVPGALLLLLVSIGQGDEAPTVRTDAPSVDQSVVWGEVDGLIVVEAEYFYQQSSSEKRAWHVTNPTSTPQVGRDIDPPHHDQASLQAYIEVLPDTGNDPVGPVAGESIADAPGKMAVVAYRVHFPQPGKYYIWARGFGSDGDDNTLHFGLDDTWPATSARMHTFAGKRWQWACRHRQHQGPIFFDVATAGVHTVTVAMREDGCELDRFVLTQQADWKPGDDAGPPHQLHEGQLPQATTSARDDLPSLEIESHPIVDGWQLATAASGYSGDGYFEWTPPGQGQRPGPGVLRFSLEVPAAGNYQLQLRSQLADPANRPDTRDPDGNDVWVRFADGTNAEGAKPLGDGWIKVALLGHPSDWSWETHADGGPPHPDTPVVRHYDAGPHAIELSGRSQGYRIDALRLVPFEQADAAP